MKRLNPDTGEPFKHGEWSECGNRVFWGYLSRVNKRGYNYEMWRTPESFEKSRKTTEKWVKDNPEKHNAHMASTRAKRLKRNPKWLKDYFVEEIKEFYKLAKALEEFTGIKHEVDHIIPLQGKLVSGLHVPWNLRVITKDENNKKRNKFEPC